MQNKKSKRTRITNAGAPAAKKEAKRIRNGVEEIMIRAMMNLDDELFGLLTSSIFLTLKLFLNLTFH